MSKYLSYLFFPWTIWCLLVFLFFNIIAFPFLFFFLITGNKTLYRYAHHIPCLIAKFSLFFWGVWVRSSGREHFDHSQQYIFVGNHRSMLDALISGGYISNYKKFIGKAEILSWPFLGYIMKRLYIPVKRESEESRKWSREQLIVKMKEGFSMVMFAEGKTNTGTEPLLPFKSGAFSTSCELQIPIVPFVIYNADNIWHRNSILIRPGIVDLRFLPVIAPLHLSEENIDIQRDQAFEGIRTAYMAFGN